MITDVHGCSSTFVEEQHYASQTSQSPSAAAEAVPAAEYQEWPFQGYLKQIRIRDDVIYNLEFKLPLISEHLHLLINPTALDINHNAAAYSKIHQALLKPKKSKVSWIEDDIKLVQILNKGHSWEYIFAALPNWSEGSIRVCYSTKFKKLPHIGASHSWTGGGSNCFIDIRAPILEKVKLSSSGNDNDSSDGNPDFSSDNGDYSKAKQGRSSTNKQEQMVRPGRAALAGIQEIT
jgi:hypothetical protein